MVRYFGYGSLVNVATLAEPQVLTPATLKGWRRRWAHRVRTPYGSVTALTIDPDPRSEIDGAIATASDWAALDEREVGYQRFTLPEEATACSDNADIFDDVSVYRSLPECVGPASHEFPIWQSYIDAVLQGFLQQFGEAGVHRFIATTSGWSAHILKDRDRPKYPRWVRLTPDERDFIDSALRDTLSKIPGGRFNEDYGD